MIFLFPDLETLRVVLSSGMVPPEVSHEAAEAALDVSGRVSVKPHAIPPKAMQNAMKRLGIKTVQTHCGEPMALHSWLQILPIVRLPETPEFTATTPVLFEIPANCLGSLATEMLRLGNDRQSFRVIEASPGGTERVLLRVIGPPYYTLLRVLDRLDADIVAYLEQAPGVWIEIGHRHPLATLCKVADGQMLLLRSPREWRTLADGSFHDIYEVLDFQLPQSAVAFAEGKLKGKLTVSLRLAAGNAAELPEMWVLRDNSFDVFDAFVRDADEQLMKRLMFAVAENGDDSPVIVLRTRTSKLTPPAIELSGASGYVPYRRLNNLFLPAGTRLQPTLRRDAVRKMLAEDDAQIVWLTAGENGTFVPESLPDDSFRPLSDWIDYVIDHEHAPLQNWIQATRFDFDDFICKEETAIEPPKPPGSSKPKSRRPGEKPEKIDGETTEPTGKGKGKGSSKESNAFTIPVLPPKPDELKIRRGELERAFLAVEGPLDSPERLDLWPQLAQVNAALGDHAEASLCWLNRFWEDEEVPAEGARLWLEAETGAQAKREIAEIDRVLALESPLKVNMRRLAAAILYASTRENAHIALKEKLPTIRQFLEKFDSGLPVRAVWLVWRSLARMSGDVLGLARIRDRLLKRLLEKTMNSGNEVPQFIRFAGEPNNNRTRVIRDNLVQFREQVALWLSQQDGTLLFKGEKAKSKRDEAIQTLGLTHQSLKSTMCYSDFIFAYGFARIGEEETCLDLIKSARQGLARTGSDSRQGDEITPFVVAVFEFRIDQALRGDTTTSLPTDLLRMLDKLSPNSLFPVDRLRQRLRILEPFERFDPYFEKKSTVQADLNSQLAALPFVHDPGRLQADIRKLLKTDAKSRAATDHLKVLIKSIPLATRVGESFAQELLDLVLPALKPSWLGPKSTVPEYREVDLHARLVDCAIPIAAHYGHTDLVERIVTRFIDNVKPLKDDFLVRSINLAIGEGMRALQKCGLNDLGSKFLMELSERLERGRSPAAIRKSDPKDWVATLRALVHLAQFWMRFGGTGKALPILDEAKAYLLDNETLEGRPLTNLYTPLVCAYFSAIAGLDDVRHVAANMSDVLKGMDPIPNTTTTKPYFSIFHLEIIEHLVLSFASDELLLGHAARFLDEDEYLVRRRIHGEMRKLLAQSGL